MVLKILESLGFYYPAGNLRGFLKPQESNKISINQAIFSNNSTKENLPNIPLSIITKKGENTMVESVQKSSTHPASIPASVVDTFSKTVTQTVQNAQRVASWTIKGWHILPTSAKVAIGGAALYAGYRTWNWLRGGSVKVTNTNSPTYNFFFKPENDKEIKPTDEKPAEDKSKEA